ncbi:hypothetical protein [Syntrophaceticus schinkii]|nr:hypothetical protein [Syntrophaceticus schinkii]
MSNILTSYAVDPITKTGEIYGLCSEDGEVKCIRHDPIMGSENCPLLK